ncbi:MAG TPA: fatty acid--CoA ligase family protein, partial [Halioglobus sp.]
THLILVVSALDQLLHHPKISALSLQNIRFAAVGADRITPRVQQRFTALTKHTLRSRYGLSESSWALVNDGIRADKALALGKPCPGVEIRLLRADGTHASLGEVGQIHVNSPRTMLGYLNNEQATRAVLADGWLATGDLAHQDEDGYYWFAGRSKDLIVLASGDNVSPTEVEKVLCSHPAIAACMVVKRATAGGSEVPWAFVISKQPISFQALRDFLHERLSDFKVPEGIEFVTELPMGLSGKIQRNLHSSDCEYS